MEPDNPTISVAMATCDGARWVESQLRSILDQLGESDQVVVADASSRDRTTDIVAHLGDPRVRIVPGLPRGDVPRTFEAALREVTGGFVFLSDQDDLWLPGKAAACVRFLSDSRAPLVVHDARLVDTSGTVLHESFFRWRKVRPGYWPNLWRPGYLGCACAFRRDLLERALPFPTRLPMHDWWLGLLAERSGGVGFISEPLILHRRHEAAANFAGGSSPFGWREKFGFRLRMLRLTAFR